MNVNEQLLGNKIIKNGGGSKLLVDGKSVLNFAGCTYLALSERKELIQAASGSIDDGTLFCRYLSSSYGGRDEAFSSCEEQAAIFFGTEAAIYLPTGYLIGQAALGALAPKFDSIFIDEQAHWNLHDAAKLHGTPVHLFEHCNEHSLQKMLSKLPNGNRPLIVTDGAFATTGKIPPLKEYSDLASKYDGQVLVDESHAAGVLGSTGRGAAQHCDVSDRIYVGTTLSKGFCASGAVFMGTHEMIERASNVKSLRGSSAGSPILANVATAALELVGKNPELCTGLRANADYLRKGLSNIGIKVADSPSAIVSFIFGDFNQMRGLQKYLFEEEIYVLHSNYIAAGADGMIRLSVFADHSKDDLDKLISLIQEYIK